MAGPSPVVTSPLLDLEEIAVLVLDEDDDGVALRSLAHRDARLRTPREQLGPDSPPRGRDG